MGTVRGDLVFFLLLNIRADRVDEEDEDSF